MLNAQFNFLMPQLDSLTYFSQYVYLLITFVAVYVFVLNFIIPKVASTLKLRQKLNSINLLTVKLQHSPGLRFQTQTDAQAPANAALFAQYGDLLAANWKVAASIHESSEQGQQTANWLVSTRALQLSDALKLKKRMTRTVRSIRAV